MNTTEYTQDLFSMHRQSRRVLEILGDKWTLLVITTLSRGTMRNAAIKNEIGDISHKMLTQTLRKLERNGIIDRTVYPVVPPRVEYALTPLGESLLPPISSLSSWVSNNFDDVEHARAEYDQTRM